MIIVVVAGCEQEDDLQQSHSLIGGDDPSWIERICGQVEFAEKVVAVYAAKSANSTNIHNVFFKRRPDANIVLAPGANAGTACSALLAVDHVDQKCELLLLSTDGILDTDFSDVVETFRAHCLDAGTIVFPSLRRRFYYASVKARELGQGGIGIQSNQPQRCGEPLLVERRRRFH